MCCVCFFCLGFLFVWRQLCWVFNILCRFLKGWESKTARNSVLLHAECGPSQCSKLIICTERICYLKKAFQKIHKGLEIHKNLIFYSRDCCPSVLPKKKKEKKKRHQRASGVDDVTICKPQWVWCLEAFDFAKEYFMAFKQPEAVWFLDVCVSVGRNREGSNPPVPNPGSEPQCFWSEPVLLTAMFFPPRLSKTTIPKVPSKKIPTTTTTKFNKHQLISESEQTNKTLII